jgi:acyl-CoA thioester hydrolase
MPEPSPDFPQPQAWLDHRVSYGETDAMGVVYYGNYLHWFEMARSLYIRNQGISYREIESKGIFLPVREASCRYYLPAGYEDQVWIRTAIAAWTRTSMTFIYEVTTWDKQRIMTTGMTQHACVNPQGKPVRIPQWLESLCRDKSPKPIK